MLYCDRIDVMMLIRQVHLEIALFVIIGIF